MTNAEPVSLNLFQNIHKPNESAVRAECPGFFHFASSLTLGIPWLSTIHDITVKGGKKADFVLTCALSPKWKLGASWKKGPDRNAVKFALVEDIGGASPVSESWRVVVEADAVHDERQGVSGNIDLIGTLSATVRTWAERRAEGRADALFKKWRVDAPTTFECWSKTPLTLDPGCLVWTNPNMTALGVLERQAGDVRFDNDKHIVVPTWFAVAALRKKILFPVGPTTVVVPNKPDGVSWTGDEGSLPAPPAPPAKSDEDIWLGGT